METSIHASIERVIKGRARARALRALAASLLTMLVGGNLVLWAVMSMNQEPPAKPEVEHRETRFAIAPKPPPKKKPKPKPKPKPRKQRAAKSAAAPPPALGASISMGSFAMPGFNVGQVQNNASEVVGDVKPTVMTADAVDRKPKPVRRVQPRLTRDIIARQTSGKVVVSAFINANGQVERVRIIESRPAGLYDQAVREAVMQTQFEPATYEGQPVATWSNIPFDFRL